MRLNAGQTATIIIFVWEIIRDRERILSGRQEKRKRGYAQITEVWMQSSRRVRRPDYEDHGIIVKDIDEANRRMEIIQSRIDAAEMLGIGTAEYEKRAARPVHLGKGMVIGGADDKTQVRIHTLQRSRSSEGNTTFCIGMDVWEKKGEK